MLVENAVQQQISFMVEPVIDNHYTEFLAMYHLLEILKTKGKKDDVIICHSDSRALVSAVEKNHVKKPIYRELLFDICQKLEDYPNFYLLWIPEKENLGADNLAKQALKKNNK